MNLKYSIITAALLIVNSSSLLYADNVKTYSLDKVLVSTTSLGDQQEIEDVQASIQVIDKKTIEKSYSLSVPQLINQALGVTVKDGGSTSSVSIRGFNSSHTLILVDGLRRTGKYGSSDLTSIQLEDIERIEIVRGPMSTIYGADAIAGVINIITKKDNIKDYNKLTILTGIAENGQRGTAITKLSGSKTISNIIHNYSIELRKKDDYREDKSQVSTDLKNENRKFINYGHTIKIDDNNRLTNNFEYSNQDDFGRNYANTKTYEKEDRYQFSSNYNHVDKNYIFDTSLGYGYSDAEVNRGSGKEKTDYKQLEFNNYLRHFTTDEMINIIGLGYKNDDIKVSMYTQSASRDNFFALYQNEYNITDSLTSNMGIRYDNFNDFGSSVNPKLSLMYKYSNFSFRTSYGTAFKAPSFTNMYSHFIRSAGPVVYDISGNKNLKPEESKTYEFALAYNLDNLAIELVHHRSNLENLINSYTVSTVGLTSYTSYKNIDKAQINGTELSVNYKMNDNFMITSGIEYLDTNDESTNKRLTGSARISYKLNLAYEVNKYGIYLNIRKMDDYYGTNESRVDVNSNYTVADLKIDYDFNDKTNFFIGVDNIQNKKMPYNMTSRGTPNDPGERYFYTGMSFKF
ncbi:MAG: TonB-dependent receptor plug domain-containing protein [Halarcobacter sp.]